MVISDGSSRGFCRKKAVRVRDKMTQEIWPGSLSNTYTLLFSKIVTDEYGNDEVKYYTDDMITEDLYESGSYGIGINPKYG